MGYGFCVRARGDRALFTRPEMKAEPYSYSVLTPGAAAGILESVFWHPGMKYVIDKITVLNPIQFDQVRRNEVGSVPSIRQIRAAGKSGEPYHQNPTTDRQQRNSVILRDVDYLIDAHFIIKRDEIGERDTPEGFYNILLRRLRKGQHFKQPCMGCREFPAYVSLVEGERPPSVYEDLPEMDLGYMVHHVEYLSSGGKDVVFHAIMRNGVIDTRL